MYSNLLIISFIFILTFPIDTIFSHENKYTQQANTNSNNNNDDGKKLNFRQLDKPFRMAKLNLIWLKGQQVSFKLFINYTC